MEDLMGIKEAARALHIQVLTLIEWVRAGKIKQVGTPTNYKFRRKDVKRIIAKNNPVDDVRIQDLDTDVDVPIIEEVKETIPAKDEPTLPIVKPEESRVTRYL